MPRGSEYLCPHPNCGYETSRLHNLRVHLKCLHNADDEGHVKTSPCQQCGPCLAADCGQCRHCLDKRKFGGPGILKKKCSLRQCLAPSTSSRYTVPVTPVKS